jgi:hypothetical protein
VTVEVAFVSAACYIMVALVCLGEFRLYRRLSGRGQRLADVARAALWPAEFLLSILRAAARWSIRNR